MELDATLHKGRPDSPAVIFIHGLSMNKNIWLNPLETKMFANNFPLKIFAATRPKPLIPPRPPLKKGGYLNSRLTVGDIPGKVDNLWDALKMKGFNLICWSQRRPVAPISVAAEELKKVVKLAKEVFPRRHIALIGHSRGGLIARKFMEGKVPGIKALITISSPHQGSSLALLGKYLKPISAVLKVALPKDTHGTVSEVIRRFNELIEGQATRELLPDSDFFKTLNDVPVDSVKYLSFGGTKTRLFIVYKWETRDGKSYPRPFMSVPDSLLQVFPPSVLPEEITSGKGDVLVSAKSSVLPWAANHYNVPANHVAILWHKKVISNTIEALEGI
ncbi:MAG: alpha/beta hydrolase [Nitrospirae bacterium]|nr:alpha/beta hydrolase [Nitrospirota bacterium]